MEQLRKESTERTLLRAVRHARETLEAGITTVRDLGEGLKALSRGVITFDPPGAPVLSPDGVCRLNQQVPDLPNCLERDPGRREGEPG
ncbi:MAG TPA: hypothetical protein VF068_03520 [Rubrobacter sp.]